MRNPSSLYGLRRALLRHLSQGFALTASQDRPNLLAAIAQLSLSISHIFLALQTAS